MENKPCPRCNQAMLDNAALYQCCRCFTVYCKQCTDTEEGRKCPKCRMGQRLVLSGGK
ncbi:hypothetical protein [Azotosporobacter soli]|uniref:hypothetical protein n=1 Tax=Azotosporobacter soli TaxID=3055040 RepID=UPI0031FED356